jgi:hypothetical protein
VLFPRKFLRPVFEHSGQTPEALHEQFVRQGVKCAPALDNTDKSRQERDKRLSENQLWQDLLTEHRERWRTWQGDLKRMVKYLVEGSVQTQVEKLFLKEAEQKYLRPALGPITAQKRGEGAFHTDDPGEVLFVALYKFVEEYEWDGIRICPSCHEFFPRYNHRPQEYCSPQCRNQRKPSRQKNKEYLCKHRRKKDQQDIARIKQVSESGQTRDRKKIAQLAGMGSRRVLWLLNEYNITL